MAGTLARVTDTHRRVRFALCFSGSLDEQKSWENKGDQRAGRRASQRQG